MAACSVQPRLVSRRRGGDRLARLSCKHWASEEYAVRDPPWSRKSYIRRQHLCRLDVGSPSRAFFLPRSLAGRSWATADASSTSQRREIAGQRWWWRSARTAGTYARGVQQARYHIDDGGGAGAWADWAAICLELSDTRPVVKNNQTTDTFSIHDGAQEGRLEGGEPGMFAPDGHWVPENDSRCTGPLGKKWRSNLGRNGRRERRTDASLGRWLIASQHYHSSCWRGAESSM